MFDLRYHVASLVAIFVALVIGIVIGVGLSEGSVPDVERDLLNARIDDLQSRLDAAFRRGSELAVEQRAAQAFIEEAYPEVVRDRLSGRNVAVVFFGTIDAGLRGTVEKALEDAGADKALRVRALRVPIDQEAVSLALAERPALAPYRLPWRLEALGRALAREFVDGGRTPLWNTLAAQLIEERRGDERLPADAVVVARSARSQQGPTARLLAGFYAGLRAAAVPAVGVEASDASVSAIKTFRRHHISSVDAADTPAGRLALVLLLAGGEPGNYGVKPTAADGILPPLPPGD